MISIEGVRAVRDALTKLIDAEVPTTPPPTTASPVTGTSPEGTTITAPTTDTITDAAGIVWGFGALYPGANAHFPGPDYFVLKNGAPPAYGGAGKMMQLKGNVIFVTQYNHFGPKVYKHTGTDWLMISGMT